MGISKKAPAVRIPMDYSRLRGRIVEKFGKQGAFAEKIGFTEESISKWLNNQVYWPHEAMVMAVDALEIDPCDIGDYFFTKLIHDS